VTLADRAAAYARSSYGQRYPDSIPVVSPTGRWLTGHWVIGNDYRAKVPLYGAYPPGYLDRLWALFPDCPTWSSRIHLFAGAVTPADGWLRIDAALHRDPKPTIYADAEALPFPDALWYGVVAADPPYRARDVETYGTGRLPQTRKVFAELARVSRSGTHLCWLDIKRPMYRKAEWEWWGAVTVLRSTNHLVREAFLFTRR